MVEERKWVQPEYEYSPETTIPGLFLQWFAANDLDPENEEHVALAAASIPVLAPTLKKWIDGNLTAGLFSKCLRPVEERTGIDVYRWQIVRAKAEILAEHPELEGIVRWDTFVTFQDIVTTLRRFGDAYGATYVGKQIGTPPRQTDTWVRETRRPTGEYLQKIIIGLSKGLIDRDRDDVTVILTFRSIFGREPEEVFPGIDSLDSLLRMFFAMYPRMETYGIASQSGLGGQTVSGLKQRLEGGRFAITNQTLVAVIRELMRRYREADSEAYEKLSKQYLESDDIEAPLYADNPPPDVTIPDPSKEPEAKAGLSGSEAPREDKADEAKDVPADSIDEVRCQQESGEDRGEEKLSESETAQPAVSETSGRADEAGAAENEPAGFSDKPAEADEAGLDEEEKELQELLAAEAETPEPATKPAPLESELAVVDLTELAKLLISMLKPDIQKIVASELQEAVLRVAEEVDVNGGADAAAPAPPPEPVAIRVIRKDEPAALPVAMPEVSVKPERAQRTESIGSGPGPEPAAVAKPEPAPEPAAPAAEAEPVPVPAEKPSGPEPAQAASRNTDADAAAPAKVNVDAYIGETIDGIRHCLTNNSFRVHPGQRLRLETVERLIRVISDFTAIFVAYDSLDRDQRARMEKRLAPHIKELMVAVGARKYGDVLHAMPEIEGFRRHLNSQPNDMEGD